MNTAAQGQTASLYRRILGSDWLAVNRTVRQAHYDGKDVLGSGTFRITHGLGRASRVLARVLRIPPEAAAAVTELRITPQGADEQWERSFDGRRLISRQSFGNGVLSEQFGILELLFRLRAFEGGLNYVQAGARLRLGPVCLPLPRWLAPRVYAREEDRGEFTHVSVQVDLPCFGRLVEYEGLLEIQDGAP